MTDRSSAGLFFSAFLLNGPSHVIHGQWRDPKAENLEFNDLRHWTTLATTLDDGGFHLMFFADAVGLRTPWRKSHDLTIRSGMQFPINDPGTLISAMALVTSRIGLAYTSSVIQTPPFTLARTMSTLDHYTEGRVGWNIVTSPFASSYRNYGYSDAPLHDERYRIAEEFVEVAYKLWEGSWDEDALVQDRSRGIHANPEKIRSIDHSGPLFDVAGPHLVSPSPQRTPLLCQAGASPAGLRFAAANAEIVFTMASSPAAVKKQITRTRELAVEYGRNPEDLQFLQGLSIVVGRTPEEAAEKEARLESFIDFEAVAAHALGDVGFDGGELDLNTPLRELPQVTHAAGIQGLVISLLDEPDIDDPTLLDLVKVLESKNRLVGTPEEIADQLEVWLEAGVGGINVIPATLPHSFTDVSSLLFPVLERRGLLRPRDGKTLRSVIGGRSDRIDPTHPAARFRNSADAPKRGS